MTLRYPKNNNLGIDLYNKLNSIDPNQINNIYNNKFNNIMDKLPNTIDTNKINEENKKEYNSLVLMLRDALKIDQQNNINNSNNNKLDNNPLDNNSNIYTNNDKDELLRQLSINNNNNNIDITNTDNLPKNEIPLIQDKIRTLKYGLINRDTFITKVSSGNFNKPKINCWCGDIFYFNNIPVTSKIINTSKGNLLSFIQDDISNISSNYTGKSNPLYISNQEDTPLRHIPRSFMTFYINDQQVSMENYFNLKTFSRAMKRRVDFVPKKEGDYFICSTECGCCIGTIISVV